MAAGAAGRVTTAIDSNVVIALWGRDTGLNTAARTALENAYSGGNLVIAAPVFAELMAAPGRTEAFLNSFLVETSIGVDWVLEEAVWKAAGRAFQLYTLRRQKQEGKSPRRILADFLIGAHAVTRGYRLLTLDEGMAAAFPGLKVETF
jgi:predicted nucleic acid-binding protein